MITNTHTHTAGVCRLLCMHNNVYVTVHLCEWHHSGVTVAHTGNTQHLEVVSNVLGQRRSVRIHTLNFEYTRVIM